MGDNGYKHGVYFTEAATAVVAPVTIDSALPVVFGTAPVHTLADGVERPINKPMLISSYGEYVKTFGAVPDGESRDKYTLSEFADIYIARYNMAPVVFVNVFDPATHQDDDGNPDASKVTSADIIGGIDGTTLKRTGLELVHEVFPRFGKVPATLVAPRFSGDPQVALTLGAKCLDISGHFRATAIIDIPDSVKLYSDAPQWITSNNLTDANIIAMFGSLKYGNDIECGSSHVAALMARTDVNHNSIPYKSPSNERLLANGIVHAGEELQYSTVEANYLNGQGIVTGLNFYGGLKLWGNRTAAYPGVTDDKDTMIPVRRMFSYLQNYLILTIWQYIDQPLMKKRVIESICDSVNQWFNSLVARECILGGKVFFDADDNPSIDTMDGVARFRIHYTPPSPARDIEFTAQYDLDYLKRLYNGEE